MSNRLSNKVAVVTGATKGIGFAIAELFADEGANVVLLDIEQQIHSVAEQLAKSSDRQCIAFQCDIASHTEVSTSLEKALEVFQKVDILVNNAGINVFSDPVKLTQADWKRCFSVDLEGVWNCCQAILPKMLEKNYGHIVNIASVHGHKIIPNCFPYPVAKHGLIGLTRSLGIQYAAQGIRVNSISPGLIMTPLAEDFFASCENPEQERKRQAEILPCKRIGEPQEVAYTALFLASDEAKFINATDILIDGGRSHLYHE